jgi:hypothetical protein
MDIVKDVGRNVYKIVKEDGSKMKKEICHVCGKVKKPYLVILDDNIMSLIHYESAREDGPICERCDKYYAMTGEFKDSTDEEFEIAKKSIWFANTLFKYWKDNKEPGEDYNIEWKGTSDVSKWCRKLLNKVK